MAVRVKLAYLVRGTDMGLRNDLPSCVVLFVDGQFRQLSTDEIKAINERDAKAEAVRIANGGCSHPVDDWDHHYDEECLLGDAYYCGHCGELMQVG